jgi:alpha-glucosidase
VELLDPENEAIFAYVKEDSKKPGRKAVVVLNMSKEQQMGPDVVGILEGKTPQLLVSTIVEGSLKLSNGRPVLRAWEGRVYVNY